MNMARLARLSVSDYAAMPWRNGAGTTLEIAIDDSPTDSSSAPFLWRLSMADLAGDGPFSQIADVDRIIVLLAGTDVMLTINGAPPAALRRHQIISFPGDVPTSMTMAPGRGRDLNLMWDRTRATGKVEIMRAGDAVLWIDAQVAFVVALGGRATVAVDDAEHVLGEQETMRLDRGGSTFAVRGGEVYLATIVYR
jgi:uncharacterized protein